MKKFSRMEQKVNRTEKNISINKNIQSFISECISIQGEYELQGVDTLLEKFHSFLQEKTGQKKKIVLEKIKADSRQYLDLYSLNHRIDFLTEQIEELNICPLVEDVFSVEDFHKKEKMYILERLNNLPDEKYNEYLSDPEINNYFEGGHQVQIKEHQGWELYFEPNLNKYYGSIEEKWKFFLIENRNFIADFIKSTTELIGIKNTRIDNRILQK